MPMSTQSSAGRALMNSYAERTGCCGPPVSGALSRTPTRLRPGRHLRSGVSCNQCWVSIPMRRSTCSCWIRTCLSGCLSFRSAACMSAPR